MIRVQAWEQPYDSSTGGSYSLNENSVHPMGQWIDQWTTSRWISSQDWPDITVR